MPPPELLSIPDITNVFEIIDNNLEKIHSILRFIAKYLMKAETKPDSNTGHDIKKVVNAISKVPPLSFSCVNRP